MYSYIDSIFMQEVTAHVQYPLRNITEIYSKTITRDLSNKFDLPVLAWKTLGSCQYAMEII